MALNCSKEKAFKVSSVTGRQLTTKSQCARISLRSEGWDSLAKLCAEAGVLGMLPSIIGNIQALEAVKIIIGIKPDLSGKLLLYDGITHETNIINIGGKA